MFHTCINILTLLIYGFSTEEGFDFQLYDFFKFWILWNIHFFIYLRSNGNQIEFFCLMYTSSSQSLKVVNIDFFFIFFFLLNSCLFFYTILFVHVLFNGVVINIHLTYCWIYYYLSYLCLYLCICKGFYHEMCYLLLL